MSKLESRNEASNENEHLLMKYEEIDGNDFDYADERDLVDAAQKQKDRLDEKAHMIKLQEEYLREQKVLLDTEAT